MTTVSIPKPRGGALRTLMRVSKDPLTALPEIQQEVGDTWLVDLPFMPTIVVSHPNAIHTVLVKDFKSYRKDFYARQLEPVLGNGLLLAEGDVWRRHRRLAQPAFHAAAIRGYAEAMVDETEETLASWNERASVDLHGEMMALTLKIVARTLFGHDIGEDAPVIGHCLDVMLQTHRGILGTGVVLPPWLPTPNNQRHNEAIAEADRIVYRILAAHRASPDPTTLLGLLIAATDEGEGLSDRELRDEAMTLLMAGHETTAVALTMSLYLLSQYPNAERLLQEELDSVLGDGPVTLDQVPALPYTRAVIQEALRLYPPAWSTGREALVDTTIGEVPVRAGTHVWIATFLAHRDPRWFSDPLSFRPERWLDGTLSKSLPDGAFAPFGLGPRLCIGRRFAELEMVLCLATVARRFAVRLDPGEALRLVPSVTLRPRGGLRATATARAA